MNAVESTFGTMFRYACSMIGFSSTAAALGALLLASGCPAQPTGLFARVQHARILADHPSSVHVIDLDADGWQDVVVGSESQTPISLRYNLGDGRLGTALRLRLDTREEVLDLGALKRSARGPTVAVLLSSGVALLTNPDGEGFSVPVNGRVARCQDCAAFVSGDFNGDGESDILVAGALVSDHYPGPTLDSVQLPRPPRLLVPPRPRAVDLDRDGTDDLIGIRDLGAGPVGVLLFGSNSGAFFARSLPAGIELAVALDAAEVDGDGLLDLVFVAPGVIGVILAAGGSYDRVYPVLVPELDPISLEVLDANGDGQDDLTIGDAAGLVRVYLGDGGGRFLQAADIELTGPPTDLHHGDLDQDGQDELLIVTPTGAEQAMLHVFRGGDLEEPGIPLSFY